MATVDVDGRCVFWQTHSPSWLPWSVVGGHLMLSLHNQINQANSRNGLP